jgi:hypothetical protein
MTQSVGVSNSSGYSSGNSSTVTISPSAGSTLVLVTCGQAPVGGVSDTNGETWNAVTGANNQTDIATYNTEISMYIAEGVTGGSTTITVTSSSGYYTLLVLEIIAADYTGNQHSAAAFDATEPQNTGGGITTTTATCVIVTGILHGGGNGSTFNAGTGWTLAEEITNGGTNWVGALAYRIETSTGTYDADWSNANNDDALVNIADYAEVTGGGTTAVPSPAQKLDDQYAGIYAAKLNGVLQ